MTVPPVEVRALYDGSAVQAGTAGNVADINAMASAVDAASADMTSSLTTVAASADTELGTNIPASADRAAVGLTTKASKFKAVGTQLGETLAQGVGSGVSGPEAVANIGTSLTGLLAPLAATGAGAIAAIGIGIGGALIGNMIKGVRARDEEFQKEVADMFQAIEVTVGQSMANIRRQLIEEFTIKEALTEIQELGISVTDLDNLTKNLGVPFSEIVEIIRGDINPANRDTLKLLEAQKKETEQLVNDHGLSEGLMTKEAQLADKLLGLSGRRVDKIKDSAGWAQLEQEALEGSAVAAERIAQAAERTGAALGNAVRQAGFLDLALGG